MHTPDCDATPLGVQREKGQTPALPEGHFTDNPTRRADGWWVPAGSCSIPVFLSMHLAWG